MIVVWEKNYNYLRWLVQPGNFWNINCSYWYVCHAEDSNRNIHSRAITDTNKNNYEEFCQWYLKIRNIAMKKPTMSK